MQRINQLERAEKFIQDRIKRLEKRETIRKELVSKNKEAARCVKKTLSRDLENCRRMQEKRIEQIKRKQAQERFEKCLFYPRCSSRRQGTPLTQRLDEERKGAERNAEILKDLTMREMNLKVALQEIAAKVLNRSHPNRILSK
eukprot:TRINITY_DN2140_c0_g1_i1.p1 TRINITY_DN2140_c0_g1~~TRINITY_DN2140_c0_g1_i1.p1  ORF type:complete len:143 (+),score=45.87 TRINITY_DN2140_c0_g1_i1:542-970(+)